MRKVEPIDTLPWAPGHVGPGTVTSVYPPGGERRDFAGRTRRKIDVAPESQEHRDLLAMLKRGRRLEHLAYRLNKFRNIRWWLANEKLAKANAKLADLYEDEWA